MDGRHAVLQVHSKVLRREGSQCQHAQPHPVRRALVPLGPLASARRLAQPSDLLTDPAVCPTAHPGLVMESTPLIIVLEPLLLASCFAYLVKTGREGYQVLGRTG